MKCLIIYYVWVFTVCQSTHFGINSTCTQKEHTKTKERKKSHLYTKENHVTSNQQQWRIPLKNPVDSGKIFFDISIHSGQIGMGFEHIP